MLFFKQKTAYEMRISDWSSDVCSFRSEAVALPEADPADARRQALEADARARHVEPVVELRIVGDQFLHLGVGPVDVLRIAREGGPAEGADAAAEQRADVGRQERKRTRLNFSH